MNPMNLKKIDLMHRIFGSDDAKKCGDCNHFVQGMYHDRILRKCECYGLTHSEASDWAKKWTACGLFGKEYSGNPIIRMNEKIYSRVEIDGQIRIGESNE